MAASAGDKDLEDTPLSDSEMELLFNAAAQHLQTLVSTLSQQKLLYCYSLYKQSVEGPCNIPKPGMFDFKGKQKWEAWKSVGDMDKLEAMERYISFVLKVDPEWEFNNEFSGSNSTWIRVSTLYQEEKDVAEKDKNAFDWVKENKIEKLRNLKPEVISCTDNNGMNLLHWAADRGYLDVTKCLLDQNVDINSVDDEGQTALHYAASCGHLSIVKTLLERGADTTIKDSEGVQPHECAEEQEVKMLFTY